MQLMNMSLGYPSVTSGAWGVCGQGQGQGCGHGSTDRQGWSWEWSRDLGGSQGLGMFGLESDARLCVNPALLTLRRTTLAQLEASWLSPCGPRPAVLQEKGKWWVCQGAGSCPCCPFGLSPVSGESLPLPSCPTRQVVSWAAKPSDAAHGSPGVMPVRGKTGLLSLASWILCAVAFWPCGTFC